MHYTVVLIFYLNLTVFLSLATLLEQKIATYSRNNNVPKKWFTYIRMILKTQIYVMVDNGKPFRYKYLSSIMGFINKLNILVKVSNKIQLSIWRKKQNLTTDIVKLPQGKLEKLGHSENIDNAKQQAIRGEEYYYHTHSWKFILDKHLRLNITFYHIVIKINKLYDCSVGNLPIKTFMKNPKIFSFSYCGIHSNTVNYPKYQNVDIIHSLRPYVSYHVKLSYSVIEVNRITSYAVEKHQELKPKWILHLVQQMQHILKIHLLVDSLKFLKIKSHLLFSA